jgi:hypothetical protein
MTKRKKTRRTRMKTITMAATTKLRMTWGRKAILLAIVCLCSFVFFIPPATVQAECTQVDQVTGEITTTPGCDEETQFGEGFSSESVEGLPSVGARLGFTSYREHIFNALSSVGSLVAWIGGFLFDVAINRFTVNMANTAADFGLDETVKLMWSVVRDLFNLLFIFGLIWAGFKLILGTDETGGKRMIGNIVIAALLINFSLFVSQIIVDVSNVAAHQLNALIQPPESTVVLGGWSVGNISTSFTQLTNLDRLGENSRELAREAGIGSASDTLGGALVLGLVFTVFYAILGFVFAAGAFILFVRFFTLIFLMIFSPIMFIGFILPKLGGYATKWWERFFNQALVGPAFIFMIYLSLRALEGVDRLDSSQYTITNLVLYLLMVTAFLWGSLMIARSLGSGVGAQAINIGQSWGRSIRGGVTRAAGGATSGLAARGLRYGIGKRAYEYADSDAAKDAAEKSWWGRRKLNLATKLGGASFDARNVGGMGKKTGLGVGIESYKARSEAIVKQEKDFAKKLGEVSDDDPKVKELKAEADFAEQAVKAQKAKLQDMRKKGKSSAEEIDAAKAELEDMEEELGDKKEALQQEKQRRQLGRVATTGESARLDDEVKTTKATIKSNMAQYIEARKTKDTVKEEEMRLAVMENKKQLAELEKKREKAMGGYADVVENTGFIKNFFLGRNADQNKEAAKKIRDEYKKKVKSKDKKDAGDKEEKGDGEKKGGAKDEK